MSKELTGSDEKTHLQVEAIKSGTVIDHVAKGQGLKIINFLQLVDKDVRLTIGLNLPTHDEQQKDIIKVNDWSLTQEEANNLYLFAPNATVNIIDEYKVVKKFKMKAPKKIEGVFDCANSNCISKTEQVKSKFSVLVKKELEGEEQMLQLKCFYCERRFNSNVFV